MAEVAETRAMARASADREVLAQHNGYAGKIGGGEAPSYFFELS